jgi:hypothetical protein
MASPRHLRRKVGGPAAVALAAAALALPAVVGGSGPEAAPTLAPATAGSYERVTIGGDELEPATIPQEGVAGSARAGSGEKKGLRLSYYVGVDFQEVEPGGAQLFEIRCPVKGEQPIAGGTFAPVAGLISVSSSRVNPSNSFPTRPRAWDQAVVNIMSTPLRWKPFVTCGTAKGIVL